MQITTHNFISPTYEEGHILYVGTHTGSFKSKYHHIFRKNSIHKQSHSSSQESKQTTLMHHTK